MKQQFIENFGANVRFAPSATYQPRTEDEVLAILNRHRQQPIRACGSLHSWSDIQSTDGVLLDLRFLNSVSVRSENQESIATVGAGCKIKRLLIELDRLGLTMPTVGLIDGQTIAGAISTGTHGSGRQSISHYIQEVRIATFDDSGQAVMRTLNASTDLRDLEAARCSLGLLGVIVSVSFQCRTQYNVEEQMLRYDNLTDVLQAETNYPIQQFFYAPWAWTFFVQHRRETKQNPSTFAGLYHQYWYWAVDVVMHLQICALARWMRSAWLSRFWLRNVLPAITIVGWKAVDVSHKMLVMEHALFRHIEIEIFVAEPLLSDAIQFVQTLLNICSGTCEVPKDFQQQIATLSLTVDLEDLKGQYTHIYPICVRKILPDETLISMASGSETVYSLSFINYQRPNDRADFLRFAKFLAESTAQLFHARPHWGKVNPLSPTMLRGLYPRWNEFEDVCAKFDPLNSFPNGWLAEILQSPPREVND